MNDSCWWLLGSAFTPQVGSGGSMNQHASTGWSLHPNSTLKGNSANSCWLWQRCSFTVVNRMCVCLDKDDWSVFNCQCCSVSSPGQRCRLMRLTSCKHELFHWRLYCMLAGTVFYLRWVIYVEFLPCSISARLLYSDKIAWCIFIRRMKKGHGHFQ